jgi:PAS domain S-box-containing protein
VSPSVYEQLETVSAELEQRLQELVRAKEELQNLLAATELPTLFVDRDLRLVRFTPAAGSLLELHEADVGRPVGEIAPPKLGRDLHADSAEVQRAQRPVERQVQSPDGRDWYMRRVTPFRRAQGESSGFVVTWVDITPMKRGEADLELALEAARASEERFRALVTASSDVVYRMSRDWSEMLELQGRMFIADTRTPSGSWVDTYLHPDDRPHILAAIAEAIRTKSAFELEHRVIRVDGSLGWTFSRAVPLLDGKGEIVEWFGAASDVTARKRAEEELRESEERFRLLVQGVKDYAIYMLTPDGIVRSWSAAAEQTFGYREAEIVGQPRAIFYTEEERRQGRPARDLEDAVRHGHHEEEAWRVRRDGSVFWANVVLTALRDDHGQLRGFANVTRDFTERKRAESALAAKQAELEVILDRTPFLITRCTRDLRYRYVTRAYAEMLGRTPGEIAGRPIVDVMGEDGLKTIRPHVEAVLQGRTVEYEDQVHFAGVGPRRLRVMYVPDRDERGQVIGWIANIIDVTERRAAEALRIIHTELLETDRRKTEFLAMLSHELRNPLAPIRYGLYTLEHAPAGGAQARGAQAVIGRQVEHMTRLIDDLLDVTRISRGKIQLKRERLDLNDLVRRTVEDHRALFTRSDVGLEVRATRAEVWVDADRVRIAQCVGNLLQNAAKFTPRGGRTTVSLQAEPGGAEAVVTVRDDGAGIDDVMLPRLFQAFVQADSTLDRSKGGLGLGLALVKGLVESHGGSVSVASSGAGAGAAFTIRLPLEVTGPRTTPAQRSPPAEQVSPRRVLVIEDNGDAADTLRDVLGLGRHTVEVACDGPDGLEKARTFHPEVVLCDIGLPRMDGYEVARRMRADPELRHAALIALSGYAQPDDVAMAAAAGFDAHLAKPPSIEALEKVMAEVATTHHRP